MITNAALRPDFLRRAGTVPVLRPPSTLLGPRDVSPATLMLWLDASQGVYSDAGTTPVAHTDPVQQWNDFSGNANHAVQATLAKRPTYRVDSGVQKVRFDGTDDVMSFTNNINFGKSRTVFAVGQLHDITGINLDVLFTNGSGASSWYVGENASLFSFSSYHNASSVQETDQGTLSIWRTGRQVATFVFNTGIAGTLVQHLRNGSSSYNATDADGHFEPASGASFLGGFDATPSFPIPIDLHELVVYDSALTNVDQTSLRAYLYAKWGIVP